MRRPAVALFALALLAAPALAAPLAAPALRQATDDPMIVQAQEDGLLPPADVAPEPGQQEGQQDLQLIQSDTTVSDLMARVQRLEASNRQLTGQLEEATNQMRRAQEDFKRYREDTEFRLQALEGGSGTKPAPRKTSEAAPPPAVAPTPKAAPLAPKNLGNVPVEPDAPVLDDPDAVPAAPATPAPRTVRPVSPTAPPGVPGIAVDTSGPPPAAPQPQPQVAAVNPAPAAPAAPQTPEDEYSADYRLIESQSYEAAELAFRKFIASYPKDKRVADATHWIGESLYQRQQYRDAAEQFLKVTTTYGSTRRAPSSMLRLGMSLAALGEKDAACATLQEVTRKYPNAPPTVKSGVDRETKKNSCPTQ